MRKVSTTSVELLSDGVRRCFLDCHSLTSEAFAARLGGSSCHQIRQRESLVKGSLIERIRGDTGRTTGQRARQIRGSPLPSRREYRQLVNVGKRRQTIERCIISTFQVAESMGFKGDFRQWEHFLRICDRESRRAAFHSEWGDETRMPNPYGPIQTFVRRLPLSGHPRLPWDFRRSWAGS